MSQNDLKNLEARPSPEDLLAEVPIESQLELNFENLTEVISQEVEQKKEEIGLMAGIDWVTIQKQVAELAPGQSAVMESQFKDSQNQLLGTVSEAAEAFDIRRNEIVINNQVRTASLRTQFGTSAIKPLAGLAKLSAVERNLAAPTKEENLTMSAGADKSVAESPFVEPLDIAVLENNATIEDVVFAPDSVAEAKPLELKITDSLSHKNKGLYEGLPDKTQSWVSEIYKTVDININGRLRLYQGRKVYERSNQQLAAMQEKAGDYDQQINNLNEKIEKFDHITNNTKSAIDPQAFKNIGKDRQKLIKKIEDLEFKKTQQDKLVAENQLRRDRLKAELDSTFVEFQQKIIEKKAPYSEKLTSLAGKLIALEADRDGHQHNLDEFTDQKNFLLAQFDQLNSLGLSSGDMRATKKVLKSTLSAIDKQIKNGQGHISKLNKDLDLQKNKQQDYLRSIGSWDEKEKTLKNWKSLDSITAVEAVTPAKTNRRSATIYESTRNELETEIEAFPMDQYVARWNMISQSDGLSLHHQDLKKLLPLGEINIGHMEQAISKVKFKSTYLTGKKLQQALIAKMSTMRVIFKMPK